MAHRARVRIGGLARFSYRQRQRRSDDRFEVPHLSRVHIADTLGCAVPDGLDTQGLGNVGTPSPQCCRSLRFLRGHRLEELQVDQDHACASRPVHR